MMILSPALHAIAARRGEGLRPELVLLLERARAAAETERVLLWPQRTVSTVAWFSPEPDITSSKTAAPAAAAESARSLKTS